MKTKSISMTKAKDIADKNMSLYIRARDRIINNGMCLICNIRPIEVNYHIFPRGNMPTRYHDLACVGSCRGCNYNECIDRREANKARLEKRYIEILGYDLYQELKTLSKTIAKFSKADIIEIAANYKKLLEEINEKHIV